MEISECPQCGAAAKPSDRKCEYCKAEFFISSLAYLAGFDTAGVGKYLKHYREMVRKDPSSVEGLLGLGMCYLQTDNYPLAQKYLEELVGEAPDNSHAYFYYAVSIIKKRRLMTLSLNESRQIETQLRTAIQLDEGKPEYKLLLAMLKRDYYETNGMKVPPPTASDLLRQTMGVQVATGEIDYLKNSVKVDGIDNYFSQITIV